MKRFFMTFLAVVTAQIFITILSITALFLLVGLVMLGSGGGALEMPPSGYLWQTIPSSLPEFVPESSLPLRKKPPSLTSILENLEKAAVDKRIKGVVLSADLPQIGWGKLQEIRDRVAHIQAAGKPVLFYSTFATTKAFYLATACDSFFLHPQGFILLGGLNSEAFFAKGLLDRMGVEYQVSQIKEYKSMAEVFLRSDMSPEAKENATWLLEEIYDDLLATLAADRGVDRALVEGWFSTGQYSSWDAEASGIIDGLLHKEEIENRLGIETGRCEFIDGGDYAEIPRADLSLAGDKIAVIHGEGLISSGESGFVFPFGISMGDETIVKALQDALDNKSVKGILIRLDTGGGLTTASDRIRQMVAEACAEKPVVVSMVDVTASGGYMAAYPCETLVALPNSIVGSIGSINMRSNISGLLNKVGISVDRVTVGPHPTILSPFANLTTDEFSRLEELHWDMYNRWTASIADARGMTLDEVDAIARGRVFTGRQALANGLVDHLGGFDLALELLKEKAGIPATEEVSFVHLPIQKNLLEKLASGELSAAYSSLVSARTESAPLEQTATFWARCLRGDESLAMLWWRF